MLTEERQRLILEKLKTDSAVYVADLVDYLEASESTIRRDLNALHNKGLLKKVHGGATLINDKKINTKEQVVEFRKNLNLEEKKKIAIKAASLIEPGNIVYIDAGTTTELMIKYISEKDALYVTNGVVHARSLAENNLKTIIVGGELKAVTEAIVGIEALKSIKKYNFTKGFFGTNGVDVLRGFTTPDINEALLKEEVIKRCKKSYVLCDSSKIGEISSITFSDIDAAVIITTNLDNKSFKDKAEIMEVDV
ncbi:transcriptional regulator, DeoR family [Clostridium sp. DSM 8431]|uniref:DeoR/GlpR family DNA-binding transcription regulator n=1 Tax=Clostridium sp. DSM 8431 TaxID=1761781 RepID=UPI0008E20CE9|nr:DeoR/GlpR family DNA-binding transcription regulator [Clostridium sp. DSM 8431]SFU46107.1 transcriptional regulator, DeoR family [Clostridium sp. DSM 8431]